MKKALILFVFLILEITPSVCQGCKTYDCAIQAAESLLKSGKYEKSLTNLDDAEDFAASDIAKKEKIRTLRKRVFSAIEKEKQIALVARDDAKKQKDIANQKTEEAKSQASIAILEKNKADSTAQIAENQVQILKNAATALEVQEDYPILSMRMLEYAYTHNPENKLLKDLYLRSVRKMNYAPLVNMFQVGDIGSEVRSINFFSNNKFIATTGHYTEIIDATTGFGKKFECVLANVSNISHNQQKILIGDINGGVILYDITKKIVENNFIEHSDELNQVLFSNDDKEIFTASKDRTIKLWNIERDSVERIFINDTIPPTSMTLSLDGSRLFSGYENGAFKIWNTQTGVAEPDLFFSNTQINTGVLSRDYNKIALGANDGSIGLYNIKNKSYDFTWRNQFAILNIRFSNDEKYLVVADKSGSISFIDIKSGNTNYWFNVDGHSSTISTISLSSDLKLAAVGDTKGLVTLWNIDTLNFVKKPGYYLDPSNKILFTKKRDKAYVQVHNAVYLFDRDTKMLTLKFCFKDHITSMILSNKEDKLLVNSYDSAYILDLDRDKILVQSSIYMDAALFTSDDKKVIGCNYKEIAIIDIEKSTSKDTVQIISLPKHLSFHPKMSIIYNSVEDNYIISDILGALVYFNTNNKKAEYEFNLRDIFLSFNEFPMEHSFEYSVIDIFKKNNIIAKFKNEVIVFIKLEDFHTDYYESSDGRSNYKTFEKKINLLKDERVLAVDFSDDKKKMLIGTNTGALIFNLETNIIEKNFLTPTPCKQVYFIPQKDSIILISSFGTVKELSILNDCVESNIYLFSVDYMKYYGLIIGESGDMPLISDELADEAKSDIINSSNVIMKNAASHGELNKENIQMNYSQIIEIRDKTGSEKLKKWWNSPKYKNHLHLIDSVKTAKTDSLEKNKLKYKSLDSLYEKRNREMDSIKQFKISIELLDTLIAYTKNDMSIYKECFDNYGAVIERGFELKLFKDVENILFMKDMPFSQQERKVLSKWKLPLLLLLQGKFKKAKKEYLKWKDKYLSGYLNIPTYREAYLIDLEEMEQKGIIPEERKKDVEAIRKLLKKK